MKALTAKRYFLLVVGYSQAGVGFALRHHGLWIEGKRKLLLSETFRLQRLALRATQGKPAAIRTAV
jgi:hypothetical protein